MGTESMNSWADDPELVATFRAEVEERLASLQAGLLALQDSPTARQHITGLFRDAHTVKGSARMLGLDDVLQVAHSCEDVLGAVRDGRLTVRRELIDLLLVACDAITRLLPGATDPLGPDDASRLVDALSRALVGDQPTQVPALPTRAESVSTESVRVAAPKVYDLLDVVGEAELDARRVAALASSLTSAVAQNPHVAETAQRLTEAVDEAVARLAVVRDGAMGLALVPVQRVFSALPRVVHDVAGATGKTVQLVRQGEEVEVDKQVLDGIADALKHLVINAVDHGCELPAERVGLGKPAQATVTVSARSAGGTVVIEVSDDGAGIDESAVRAAATAGRSLLDLLCTPAFSTAEQVTETSGRGVGLDVVRTSVEQLGGQLAVQSAPGAGTLFTLTLPVTLGVVHCLLARVGDEQYAVPVATVVESLSLKGTPVHAVGGSSVIVRNGQSVPLVDLGAALDTVGERNPRAAILTRHGERLLAWAVDRLDGESQVVAKDLGGFLGRLPLVTGATIDSEGTIVCLLDVRELADRVTGSSAPVPRSSDDKVVAQHRPRVLVVEDSVAVRELERVLLEAAGFDVVTAIDGLDAAARLRDNPADLVLSDIEMPGMDGFALTRTIRGTRGWEHVPIVIMTSRGDDEDKKHGIAAGASAYLLKSQFDQSELVQTVRRLVGR